MVIRAKKSYHHMIFQGMLFTFDPTIKSPEIGAIFNLKSGSRQMLQVNEQPYDFRDGMCARDLAAEIKPDADVFIVNGFPVAPDTILEDGDSCWLIRKGERPAADEMERLLYARHTPGVHDRIKNASVGVMGLGGLGSVVAISLARIGVGKMLLADFDIVEPSNLNRQQYLIDQVGMLKVEALKENLARINPYLEIESNNSVLSEESIPEIFTDVDVLAECFDTAEMKAAALRCALTRMQGTGFVGVSGVAGYEENDLIMTRKIRERVYLVGDGETAAAPGQGLMAPRVGIAANCQANQILRILLGKA